MLPKRESVEPSPENCACTIFVKGFGSSLEIKKKIYDIFSTFGTIVKFHIFQDRNGTSKGYGFIQYDNEQAVKMAIDKLNGILLFGKRLRVSHFEPHADRECQMQEKANLFTNLYVDNFGIFLSDKEFFEMFQKYGNITSHKIMTDDYGTSKGFGFVSFSRPDAARRAVEDLNGKIISNGKALHVCPAHKREERKEHLRELYKDCNLFISNLSQTVKEEELCKEFSRFGTIVSTKIMVDQNGRSKGFGFVCFSNTEEARTALKIMKGSLTCSTNELHVSLAKCKEDKMAYPTSDCIQETADVNLHQMCLPIEPRASSSGHFVQTTQNMQSFYNLPQAPRIKTNSLREPALRPEGIKVGATSLLDNKYRSATAPTPIKNQWPNNTQMYNFYPNFKSVSNTRCPSSDQKPLTATMLATVSPKLQKKMLGEKILSCVALAVSDMDLAYKITGALLENDNADLLFMLEHNEHLKSKVEEVKADLQSQGAQNSQKAKSNSSPRQT